MNTTAKKPMAQAGIQQISTIAAFDFDKTMSDRHSFWRFLRFVSPWKFYTAIFPLFTSIVKYYAGNSTLMKLREKAIMHMLCDIPEEKFSEKNEEFARDYIPAWISPSALERLRWHQDQGHCTVLVSNAPENYIVPWAHTVGFDKVIGSRFEIRDNKTTGLLFGNHCYGQEKVNRLQHEFGDLTKYCIYAYGDSEGDKELLEIAHYPHYRIFD